MLEPIRKPCPVCKAAAGAPCVRGKRRTPILVFHHERSLPVEGEFGEAIARARSAAQRRRDRKHKAVA